MASSFTYSMVALMLAVGWVFLGELAATRLPLLRRVFLPGAVLGGALALVAGPQGLDPGHLLPHGTMRVDALYQAFGQFPSVFINVVFACLMLGKRIDGLRTIWKRAYRQVVMGHVYAWGQYVVGLALAVFLLTPFFDVSDLAGPIIAIGFQGGHGTAAGLSANFEALGFDGGVTVAYTVATFGIVAGAIGGPVLATFLVKKYPWKDRDDADHPDEDSGAESAGDDDRKRVGFSPLTGTLTLHVSLVAVVIGFGWLLLRGIQALEVWLRSVPAPDTYTRFVPLFSVVLIVGFATQILVQTFHWDHLFQRRVLNHISAFSLDMVIFGALATLTLAVVGEYWVPILTLCLGGLFWNLAAFFGLGPHIYPRPWYPYGLGDLGGGTATTASGLLLIRIADPDARTEANQAYSEKQPFYEPFMGGGWVTAFSLPIVAAVGAGIALAITGTILALWLVMAGWIIKRNRGE